MLRIEFLRLATSIPTWSENNQLSEIVESFLSSMVPTGRPERPSRQIWPSHEGQNPGSHSILSDTPLLTYCAADIAHEPKGGPQTARTKRGGTSYSVGMSRLGKRSSFRKAM